MEVDLWCSSRKKEQRRASSSHYPTLISTWQDGRKWQGGVWTFPSIWNTKPSAGVCAWVCVSLWVLVWPGVSRQITGQHFLLNRLSEWSQVTSKENTKLARRLTIGCSKNKLKCVILRVSMNDVLCYIDRNLSSAQSQEFKMYLQGGFHR